MACALSALLSATVGVEAQQRPAPLPLTQLDERTPAADLDNRAFTLTFSQPVAVRDLLLLLVRGTSLSIVPDPGIGGTFIGELKNVTIRQALSLILQPLGFDFVVDGTFIRVVRRQAETRIFDVNYIATVRAGESIVAGEGPGGSRASVSSTTRPDVFGELANAVKPLLSEKATFTLDRTAGLLQVTDFPERLDRVAIYLDAMHERVLRQIQIDVQMVEVELSDEHASGIDWRALGAELRGSSGASARAPKRALTGLRVTDPARLLELLAAQGKVGVLASPSLLAVNNEPAIVRADTVTISVTPQASGDGAIMLDVAPIVAYPGEEPSPKPAVVGSDMLARVADGETLVLGGFTRDREVREKKNLGEKGGWFGRGTAVVHRRVELVILFTPRVIVGVNAQ